MVKKSKYFLLAMSTAFCLSCSTKHDKDFDVKLSILKTSETVANEKILVAVSLCNRSKEDFYLPDFHSMSLRLEIAKLDSSQKYVDFKSDLWFFRITRDEPKIEARVRKLHKDPLWIKDNKVYVYKDHFADSLAQMLAKNELNENYRQGRRFRYYMDLEAIGYVKAKNCLNDTVDLSVLNNFRGDFKIWFEYYNSRPYNLDEKDTTDVPFEKGIPKRLKGFRNWRGKVISDTLQLHL